MLLPPGEPTVKLLHPEQPMKMLLHRRQLMNKSIKSIFSNRTSTVQMPKKPSLKCLLHLLHKQSIIIIVLQETKFP